MSQENVEMVRAAFEAWNAGDMDAFSVRWWEQVRETWDADTVEPISDFVDAGDRVAVRQVWRGAGRVTALT